MSVTYNYQGPTEKFKKPVKATVIATPTTCKLELEMKGTHDNCEKMPGLGVLALLSYGRKKLEVRVCETVGDLGENHIERRSVCTGTKLAINEGTEVILEPIPKTDLIRRADTLLRKGIGNIDEDDAWTLLTIIRSLWPYNDDRSIKDLCQRAEPVIEQYVKDHRKPHSPSLSDLDQLFDQLYTPRPVSPQQD